MLLQRAASSDQSSSCRRCMCGLRERAPGCATRRPLTGTGAHSEHSAAEWRGEICSLLCLRSRRLSQCVCASCLTFVRACCAIRVNMFARFVCRRGSPGRKATLCSLVHAAFRSPQPPKLCLLPSIPRCLPFFAFAALSAQRAMHASTRPAPQHPPPPLPPLLPAPPPPSRFLVACTAAASSKRSQSILLPRRLRCASQS